ncbi:hypothetical protein CR513_12326, partial [Mucuna pruriens]
MQIGQLAKSVSQIQSTESGNHPSQTIPNPKGGNMSPVMLRSGKELQVVPRPKPNPTYIESEPNADSRARTASLPFPSRLLVAIKPKIDEDLLKMFWKVEINNPLLDAIKQIPKYEKFLKELCIHKRKKLKAGLEVGGVLWTFIQKEVTVGAQPALPRKCRDPGIFSVPCTIGKCTFADAMLDLGGSINVMLASPTSVVIQLANRSVVQPVGILKDVLVQVNGLIFPTDFYVLDMEDAMFGKGSTLILGWPFLMTVRTKIDVYAGTLSMEFGDNLVQLNIFEAMKHLPKDHSFCNIDMIEKLVEKFTQLDSGSDNMSPFFEISNMFPFAKSVPSQSITTESRTPLGQSKPEANRDQDRLGIPSADSRSSLSSLAKSHHRLTSTSITTQQQIEMLTRSPKICILGQ